MINNTQIPIKAYAKAKALIRERSSVGDATITKDCSVLKEQLALIASDINNPIDTVIAFAHIVGLKEEAASLATTNHKTLQVEALASDVWWNSLNRDQQDQYIELHPASKYAHERMNQQVQPQPQPQPQPQQPAPAPVAPPQAEQPPVTPQPPAPEQQPQVPQPQPVAQQPVQPQPQEQQVQPQPPVAQQPVQQPQPPVDPNQQPQPAPVVQPPVAQQPLQPQVQPQPAPVQPPAQPAPTPEGPANDQVPGKPKLSERLMQQLKKVPPTAAKFFHDGGTQAGSPERRNAAQHLRDKSKGFASHLMHQGKEVKDGLHGIAKLIHTRSWTGLHDHDRKAIKSLGVEIATLAGGIALTGGMSHLVHAPAMIALKHVGSHWFAEAAMKAAGHAVVHSNTVTAGVDEQKMLMNFINSIADMLENGDIPEEAWEKTADDIAAQSSGMQAPPKDAVQPHPREKDVTEQITDSPRPGVGSEDLQDDEANPPTVKPTDGDNKKSVGENDDVEPDEAEQGEPDDDDMIEDRSPRDQVEDGDDISPGPRSEDQEVPTNPDAKAVDHDDAPENKDEVDQEMADDEVDEIPCENCGQTRVKQNTQNAEKDGVADTPDAPQDSETPDETDSSDIDDEDEEIDEIPTSKDQPEDEKKKEESVKLPYEEFIKGREPVNKKSDDDLLAYIKALRERRGEGLPGNSQSLSKALAEAKRRGLKIPVRKERSSVEDDPKFKALSDEAKDYVRYSTLTGVQNMVDQDKDTLKNLKTRGPQHLIPIVEESLKHKQAALKYLRATNASIETSRIKGANEYTWLKYTGKPCILNFRGTRFTLEKGMEFGVRMSSNKKDKRLIVDAPEMGLTKVITITPELEKHLMSRCEKV